MTTEITPHITIQFAALLHDRDLQPDAVWNARVSPDCSGRTAFALGCQFHDVLLRLRDRDQLNRSEREMMHWLSTLRDLLRDKGVSFLEPEVQFKGVDAFPGGIVDLLVHGGLSPLGAVETKVVDRLPCEPRAEHLLQLAGYEELISLHTGEWRLWGAVAYLCMREGKIRVFAYRRVNLLRRAARQLLAA